MTRTLPTGYLADASAVSAEFVHLISLDFSSGTVYLSTGTVNLLWNGHTWSAVGGLLELGAVEESQDLQAQGADLKLSGVDQTVLSELLNANYRGYDATIYRARLNQTTGQIIGTPLLLFMGKQLNPYTVEEQRDSRNGGTVTISTKLGSVLSITQVRGIRAQLISHQQVYSGDTFFQNIASLGARKVYWATTAPADVGYRRGTHKAIGNAHTRGSS